MRVILLVILSFSLSCKGYAQCQTLPTKFSSWNQAINTIERTKFTCTDILPEGKSSWIRSAKYYSCDGSYGYLVYTTVQGKAYIHEDVPIKIWRNFKNASSSGSYYDHNIKGRYRLVPR